MHILVLATEYPPRTSGIGNVASSLVQQLERMGHSCTVCSPSGRDIQLGSHDLIERTGILGLLHFWLQVSHHFEDNIYDAIWIHQPLFLRGVAFQNAVYTIHTTYRGEYANRVGSPILQSYKKTASLIERSCLRKLGAPSPFTVIDPAVCSELEAIGIQSSQVHHIPNGVDSTIYKPSRDNSDLRAQFELPEEGRIILSLGRLTPQKQPEVMVDLYSRIEGRSEDVTLAIAGTGELLERVKARVRSKGLESVKFLGYVPESDKPDLYACADYYIMTSRYEGQPLSLLEAMSSGLPCIVSDIPNLRMVRDARCGITIQLKDIGQDSEAIISYLESDTDQDSIRAREHVLQHYDWRLLAERYLKVFEQAAQGREIQLL